MPWQIRAFGAGLSISKRAYSALVERGDLKPEEGKLFHNAMSDADTMYAMMNWYRANIPAWDEITDDDMWPSPDATIDVPALIIWAEKDTVAVPKLVDELANSSPTLEFVNLPGINHWTSMEQSEKTNAAIRAFLKEKGE